ncbi:hypothetical protein LCGC14_0767890 [marine sediment metagenome]|uniref:Uncharacterized protein n=1 Tax=marine sediment metagenome TaxID=412755 RepID=A0A0F9Q3F4_9ZZZZ
MRMKLHKPMLSNYYGGVSGMVVCHLLMVGILWLGLGIVGWVVFDAGSPFLLIGSAPCFALFGLIFYLQYVWVAKEE